jgi:hypothetical protein
LEQNLEKQDFFLVVELVAEIIMEWVVMVEQEMVLLHV